MEFRITYVCFGEEETIKIKANNILDAIFKFYATPKLDEKIEFVVNITKIERID